VKLPDLRRTLENRLRQLRGGTLRSLGGADFPTRGEMQPTGPMPSSTMMGFVRTSDWYQVEFGIAQAGVSLP
jgi:hypothetical protein